MSNFCQLYLNEAGKKGDGISGRKNDFTQGIEIGLYMNEILKKSSLEELGQVGDGWGIKHSCKGKMK